jgi:putative spermidine/putrescine transport system permease protein
MAHAEDLLANPTSRSVASDSTFVESWRTTPRAARLGGFPWPVVPFLIFCLILEIIPMMILIRDSLRELGVGAFTLSNYWAVTESLYWHSLRNSILLSGGTAILGAIWGGLVAAAIVQSSGRAQRWLMGLIATTSNFSGIPLALAFIAVLGASGMITLIIRNVFGFRLYPQHFSLYSWTGLTLVYLYFQIPLMVLLFAPSLARLKPQWQEAASMLGASSWTYWRRVGLPVLAAPFTASLALLFASALGAYATAWGLSGGKLSLFTIQIAFEVNGDVSFDPGKASAMSLILAGIMALSIVAAQLLMQRTQRWLS